MELHFSSARSAVVARGVVLEAIHRFKYQRALWFENFLADLLVREAEPALRGQDWDFIVPVPLHPLKQREREFNQAEILARHLSAATEIPLNTNLLRRVITHGDPDAADARAARGRTCAARLPCANALQLDGERVVLVDDVFTTGATTSACARALAGRGRGRGLRLDSGARTLVLLLSINMDTTSFTKKSSAA